MMAKRTPPMSPKSNSVPESHVEAVLSTSGLANVEALTTGQPGIEPDHSLSMREMFRHHHRFSDAEQDAIWKTAIFAVDANVLLNVYRYADSTRSDLLRALRAIKQQVHIPHQVAKEFYRRRIDVIQEQAEAYVELEKQLDSFLGTIRSSFHRSAFLRIADIEEQLRKAVDAARDLVAKRRDALPDLLHDDVLLEELTEIIGNSVGPELSRELLEKRCTEAQTRLERQVPPGFRDAKKPAPDRYGDVLIWFELLDLADSRRRPVVFVTDDEKDDWWLIIRGQKLGPRPELRQEMRQRAAVEFHIFTAARFLEKVSRELDVKISKASIDDASRIAAGRVRDTTSEQQVALPTSQPLKETRETDDERDSVSVYEAFRQDQREREKELVVAALRANNGNITHAAAWLGITREGLHKKIRSLGIRESSEESL